MLGRVQGLSGPLSPLEVPQGWEELCRGCVTQHTSWQLQPPPLGWKGSQNPGVTTTALSTLSSSLPPPLLVFTPRPFPPFNNFIAVAKLPHSSPPPLPPPSFCDHSETKRKQSPENSSSKWPARESQGRGVNSLFRSPRVSAAWQPSCRWIFMWAQENAQETTKCAEMDSRFLRATCLSPKGVLGSASDFHLAPQ